MTLQCDGESRASLWSCRNACRILGPRLRAYAAPIREVPWCHLQQKYYPSPWDPRDRRRTVLVVTPYAILPPTHGGAHRIMALLKHIAEEYRIILLSDEAQSLAGTSEVWFTPFRAVHLLSGRNEVANCQPPRIARMLSHSHRPLGDELVRIVRIFRPDLVQIEYIELALLARWRLGWDTAGWLAHGTEPATADFLRTFDAAIDRRAESVPVAYITGEREFYGRQFRVSPAVLVPRPDTEILVDEALKVIDAFDGPSPIVVDAGTGSGAIAVALAVHAPAAVAPVHRLDRKPTVPTSSRTTSEPDSRVWAYCRSNSRSKTGRVPVVAGCSANATSHVIANCVQAEALGADAIMLVHPYYSLPDERELYAHYAAVSAAVHVPIMIYNNPPVYGVDVKPETFAELAGEKTIVAIKESSDDPRRITDLHNLHGDRFILFCGVDDLLLESCALGIEGWVSGLTDVFPEESVALWNLCQAGRFAEARALYRWFAPLLHLDTSPKLVQHIKIGQQVVGLGSEKVRAPRLELAGEERDRIIALYEKALATRPKLSSSRAAQ